MSSIKTCSLEKSLCCPKPKKCCKVETCSDEYNLMDCCTKVKKCSKVTNCHDECDPVECCPTVHQVNPCATETAVDCCSLPYQRLDKLRSVYTNLSSSSMIYEQYDSFVTVAQSNSTNEVQTFKSTYTRGGSVVTVPQSSLFTSTYPVPSNIVGFFPVSNEPVSDTNSISTLPVVNSTNYSNAAAAYNFVQTMRYTMYRDVVYNAADQVMGWYVNPTGQQLQVFQDLTGPLNALGLTYTDTLQYYNDITTTLTNQQKQKLASLNMLYDLSINVLRKVNLNPKTEGNIMNMCDKCGQEWMVVVNTADVPTGSGYQPGFNGYVIVACRV
jgi:hypothetical protein